MDGLIKYPEPLDRVQADKVNVFNGHANLLGVIADERYDTIKGARLRQDVAETWASRFKHKVLELQSKVSDIAGDIPAMAPKRIGIHPFDREEFLREELLRLGHRTKLQHWNEDYVISSLVMEGETRYCHSDTPEQKVCQNACLSLSGPLNDISPEDEHYRAQQVLVAISELRAATRTRALLAPLASPRAAVMTAITSCAGAINALAVILSGGHLAFEYCAQGISWWNVRAALKEVENECKDRMRELQQIDPSLKLLC